MRLDSVDVSSNLALLLRNELLHRLQLIPALGGFRISLVVQRVCRGQGPLLCKGERGSGLKNVLDRNVAVSLFLADFDAGNATNLKLITILKLGTVDFERVYKDPV